MNVDLIAAYQTSLQGLTKCCVQLQLRTVEAAAQRRTQMLVCAQLLKSLLSNWTKVVCPGNETAGLTRLQFAKRFDSSRHSTVMANPLPAYSPYNAPRISSKTWAGVQGSALEGRPIEIW